MYKIDKHFGTVQKRLVLKGGCIAAKEENLYNSKSAMHSRTSTTSSSLMKKHGQAQGTTKALVPSRGPPITTNIDDQNAVYQHQFKHEKTIEAVITDYPGRSPASVTPQERVSYDRSFASFA